MACRAIRGHARVFIRHPQATQGGARERPGRTTADRGGRSDAIARASRHSRAPNRAPCFGSSMMGQRSRDRSGPGLTLADLRTNHETGSPSPMIRAMPWVPTGYAGAFEPATR